jgi:hypothetical protein
MKKILIVLFICISMNALANSGKPVIIFRSQPPDTTVLPQILNLPLSSYIGKPVDSLFSVLPIGYTDRQFIPVGIGYCRGVFQSYGDLESNTVSVAIFIDNFQYMTFPNRTKTTTWNMNLAKQETISYIRVIKNNKLCLFGCSNPNYYD